MGKGGLAIFWLFTTSTTSLLGGNDWKILEVLGRGGFGSFGSFGGLVVWVPPSRCNAAPKRCSWPGSEKRSQTKNSQKA